MAKQSSSNSSNGNGKAAWLARSDRGPHTATLPSGQQITFVIPDSNALVRSDHLPDHLAEVAVMAAAYPGGADGYMEDLATRGLTNEVEMPKLAKAVKDGLELRDWLVSHMLVDPKVDPADVPSLPDPDVQMLMEFAERARDTDAAGVKLPIVMLEVFARFRDEPVGTQADGVGERVGAGVPGVDSGADGDDL